MTRVQMLTARDVMSRKPIAVRAEAPIADAIRVLLRRDVSGVPVVDGEGGLVGILSERDCLRVIAVGQYSAVDHDEARSVAEFMTEPRYTVGPEAGLYSLADFFLTHHERRLPVIEGDRLIGIVCRRDVLKGIRRTIRRRKRPTPTRQRAPRLYPSATETPADALGDRLG